jgi:hypothetical protein
MFKRNIFAKRFLSIPFFVFNSERKDFRVFEMLLMENLEHLSVSSYPERHGESLATPVVA